MADGRRVRAQRRNPDGSADRRHARGSHWRQPGDTDLLRRLHERRRQPGLLQVLRVHVAVHRIHGRTRAGLRRHPGVRVLGAGRPLFVPADRVLVQPLVRCERGQEGVHRHQGRRLRIPARDPVPVLQSERAGGGGTQRAGHRGPLQGRGGGTDRRRCRHLDSRRDIRGGRRKVGAGSHCTPGCRTLWRVQHLSAR